MNTNDIVMFFNLITVVNSQKVSIYQPKPCNSLIWPQQSHTNRKACNRWAQAPATRFFRCNDR